MVFVFVKKDYHIYCKKSLSYLVQKFIALNKESYPFDEIGTYAVIFLCGQFNSSAAALHILPAPSQTTIITLTASGCTYSISDDNSHYIVKVTSPNATLNSNYYAGTYSSAGYVVWKL